MEEKEPSLKEMNTTLNNLTSNLNDLTRFLQEHMVTKEELKNELSRFATKKDLRQTEHRILDTVGSKLADFKGELVSIMRKFSKQLSDLIGILRSKEILTEKENDCLMSLAPFPRSR